MNERRSCILGVAAVALLIGALSAILAADETRVLSPDASVQAAVVFRETRPHFEIRFKNRPVIEASPLIVLVDGVDITDGAQIKQVKSYELKDSYPWRGVHSQALNHCKGVTISFEHPKSNTAFGLELRAFNDGVAFRYIIPDVGKTRIPDEATRFTLPAGSTVWSHDLEGHYEAVHAKKEISDVKPGEWAAPPLTFKLPDAGGYGSITEAALVNYSGMALHADGRRGFNLVLGHKHPPSYPFRLRYAKDVERLAQPAALPGPITSPWRVIVIGADLNALVNSDIVHNLCPPADLSLFPQGLRTEWVKPGRAVWRYLDGGDNNLAGMKEFSRLAGELGFEYHVVEGFWSRWTDEQIKELVDYSRKQGVGLWFWRHSRELRTAEAREAFFRRLRELGVVGAKIDFFDHEHQEVVDLYPALLQEAAKHRIMVNFHGANKPTGEPRTWPNELIREGVRGMESSRLKARALHNTTLPFTRFLAGHADYTPVHFGARRGDTTWVHQIASAAVFTEPLLTYGAHPRSLLDNPAVEMIKSIPAVWDETVVLPISEIGEVAAFARRHGDTWFVAILNGPAARNVRVPLSFLVRSEYQALLVRDQPEEPAAVRVEKAAVRPCESLTIELIAGGGFIGRFSRE